MRQRMQMAAGLAAFAVRVTCHWFGRSSDSRDWLWSMIRRRTSSVFGQTAQLIRACELEREAYGFCAAPIQVTDSSQAASPGNEPVSASVCQAWADLGSTGSNASPGRSQDTANPCSDHARPWTNSSAAARATRSPAISMVFRPPVGRQSRQRNRSWTAAPMLRVCTLHLERAAIATSGSGEPI